MRLIRLLKQDLAREINEWTADGIIDDEQQRQLLHRYDINPDDGQSLRHQVLVGLGIFFLGLSVITLLGANWDSIPRCLRTFGLVSLTAATQLFGWYYYKKQATTKAIGLFFLGNFFYGASIILIAQIFHLGEHMPDGVYWWALGCLPFALLTRSRLLALQTLALASIWLLIEANLGFLPTTYPLFIALVVYVLIVSPSLTLLLSSVAGFALWLQYAAASFWSGGGRLSFEVEHVALTASVAALFYGFSHWLSKQTTPMYQDYGAALGLWCLRFIVVLLLLLSFEEPWNGMLKADWDNAMSLAAMCAFMWTGALYFGLKANYYRSLVVFCLVMLLTIPALLLVDSAAHAVAFQFAYNLIVIGLGTWLIVRGVRTMTSHYFWTGVTTILLVALFRYFDLIGNYVGGSILFLCIAGVLFGAARYWQTLEVSRS